MRSAVQATFGIAIAAIAVLAFVAAGDKRRQAFALPLVATEPAARIGPGETACQRPLAAQVGFRAVDLVVASDGPARLVAGVVPLRRGRGRAARAELEFPGGRSRVTLAFDRNVREEERFALCVRNAGPGRAELYGKEARADDGSAITGDGARANYDMSASFIREQPSSVLGDVPEMFDRAALFKFAFLGSWTFWLLLVAVALGVPALLAAALRSAVEPDG